MIENVAHENYISVINDKNDVSEETANAVHADVTDDTDRSREHRSKLTN